MNRTPLLISLALYVGAIVFANALTDRFGLVDVGFGLLVTAGTFAAGFALLARDFVHRYAQMEYGKRRGIAVVLGAIAVAGVISWITASPQLAVASTVAFLAAELVDLGVFIPVRERLGFTPGVLTSNIVSTPVDTFVFLAIAGFPITLATVSGQLVGKLVWATLIPLALYAVARSARDMRVGA